MCKTNLIEIILPHIARPINPAICFIILIFDKKNALERKVGFLEKKSTKETLLLNIMKKKIINLLVDHFRK